MKYRIKNIYSACIALALITPATVLAQAFPEKPIRIIVPAPPGGSTDIMARTLGKALADRGVVTFVENRAGAGGAIGLAAVATAAPDGYTIGVTTPDGITVLPHLRPATPYRAEKDFDPVALMAKTNYVYAVSSKLPVNSLAELIALAKQKPGQLKYASQGAGTSGHLVTKMLELRTGADFLHVPYKGIGPAMLALVGGEADVTTTSPASLKSHIESGTIKGLAITGSARTAMLPTVPTVIESGFAGFEASAWWGVVAPRGLPADVGKRLNDLVVNALRTTEMSTRIAGFGAEPSPSSQAEFGQLIRDDSSRWKKVIDDGKISISE